MDMQLESQNIIPTSLTPIPTSSGSKSSSSHTESTDSDFFL